MPLAFWKTTTAVLAVATAVLAVLLARRETPVPAPESAADRRPAATAPVPSEESGDALDEEDRTSPDPAVPEEREAEEAPAGPREIAGRLVRVLHSGKNLDRAIREAIAAGPEIAPILRGWIESRREIWKAGGDLGAVYRVYAEVGGAAAVPFLAGCVMETDRPDRYQPYGPEALRALCRIDDPAAADALESLLRQWPNLAVNHRLLALTENGLALLRRWEREPPAAAPDRFGGNVRHALFMYGTPEDRERLWPTIPREERGSRPWRYWVARYAETWGPPWPARFRAEVEQDLESEDPARKGVAYECVLEHPRCFDPGTVARVEQEVERADWKHAGKAKKILRERGKDRQVREILNR